MCHSFRRTPADDLTTFLALCFLPSDFGKVVEAIDKGTIKPQDMITRKIALDRVVEDGFEALIHEKDKHVKIMIDMGIGEK